MALTSTNHAKLYGLYPQKGTIAIGSDADLALWDPNKSVVITNDILHHGADYTPYEGMTVQGWPIRVMLRGKTIINDGKHVSEHRNGTYLKRQRSMLK